MINDYLNANWLFQKTVDWSILTDGVTIPVKYQILIESFLNSSFEHGNKSSVKVRLDGNIYNVLLTNVNFDRDKFVGHADMIQLRWNRNSPFVQSLRMIFKSSFDKLLNYRNNKNKANFERPEVNESIIFAFNIETGIVDVNYITENEVSILSNEISKTPENVFEEQQNSVLFDETASIGYSLTTLKIRRLNRSILLYLKNLYDYHCQICGMEFEKYGSKYIEAHHIIPFVQSINNNSDNILVLCPNHHRVMHFANPVFYPEKHIFVYPNGLKEALLINKHIEIA